jgi:hypothetical protein
VWLLPGLECLATLVGHYSRIECLALGADEGHIFSGSADMSVMSWDVLGKAAEQGFVEHTDSVTALCSSRAGAGAGGGAGAGASLGGEVWLFSGSVDCTVQVWAGRREAGAVEAPPTLRAMAVTAGGESVDFFAANTPRAITNTPRVILSPKGTTLRFT